MAKLEVPFANQTAASAVQQNSREVLVNMFAELESSGRRKIIRRQRMGLDLALAKTGEKRAIEKHNGVHYVVIGDKFATYDGTTYTERGTLDTSTGYCTIIFDDNGDVLISDGATGYHWDGASFTKPDTQGDIGHVTFISGYAVGPNPGTGQFKWSAVNDMQSWDGLDFATAEAKSDNLVRVYEDHRELWLFGSETTEVWVLSGGGDSAFVYNTSMERGLRAALSVAADDNTLFFHGDDDVFYRADGYRPSRISNHTVERLVQNLPVAVRESGIAFTFHDQGHKFIVWRYAGSLSIAFNIATGLWSVFRSFGYDDWQVIGPQWTKTDYVLTPGGFSTLTRTVNTDNGEVMERGGISPPMADGDKRIVLRSYFLDCEVGRAGIGVEPQVMLRVARDGETFGNERWRSLGEQGDYKRRAVWRGLGIMRKGAIEVMVTDDFEFAILGAEADGDILS